jgi:hypothetical protein
MNGAVMRSVYAVAALSLALPLMASSPFRGVTPSGDYVDPSGLRVIAASHDTSLPESMRDLYAAYDALGEASPDDFGYASPNLRNGVLSVAVVTPKGRALLSDFSSGRVSSFAVDARLTPSAETNHKRVSALQQAAIQAAHRPVAVTSAPRSRSEVERDKHALIDWAADPRFVDADIWQTSVERSTGRVIVTASALTPVLARALVAAYGTEKVVVEVETNPQASINLGRLYDGTGFYGGALIQVPSGYLCTDAFAWRLNSGTAAMVTAGHCVPTGGSISTPKEYMGGVPSGTAESWTTGTGTVSVPCCSGLHGDGAIITVTSGKTSLASVYRGAYDSTTSSQVKGMITRRAQEDDQYCTGASFSGEICGWTVDKVDVDVVYANNAGTARNVVRSKNKQGWCARPGDSGGSVFITVSGGVAARGVTSGGAGGGSDYYGGLLDQCSHIFTDIYDIYYGLPGSLA